MARDVVFIDQIKDVTFAGVVTHNGNLATGSASNLGFYGTTPIAQPAAPGSILSTSSVISGGYGYSTTQATAILTTVNAIRAALVALGITAGP